MEFNYSESDVSNTRKMKNILYIMLLLNIILVVINILRYILFEQFLFIKEIKDETMKFMRKRDYFWILMETFMILMGPFTFFIGETIVVNNMIIASDIYYFWNDYLHMNQLYKVIIILRSYLRSSEFSSNRAYRVW